MEVTAERAHELFDLISGTRNLNRLDATKYLFFVFCKESLCDLLIFNKNTLLYEKPTIDDPHDMLFNFNRNYFLRIISTTGYETIFEVNFMLNDDTEHAHILISVSSFSF
jgi:hypothetical protein